jgi:hypothetical protein
MKKLKLDLDRLRVETFQTAAADARRGTVRGLAMMDPVRPEVSTDQPNSCLDSHDWSCGSGY